MPAPSGSGDLTGATRYRQTFFRRRLILEVEERFVSYHEGRLAPGVERTPVISTFWRDATSRDLVMLDYMARRERATVEGTVPPPPPERLI